MKRLVDVSISLVIGVLLGIATCAVIKTAGLDWWAFFLCMAVVTAIIRSEPKA